MPTDQPPSTSSDEELVLAAVADNPDGAVDTGDFQSRLYKAIAVQRPVVLEYLKSVRRDKPHATPSQILKELDRRYVATVTVASTGVGASAAIPVVGIPVALGLGVADLVFFYEASALYVLAVAELHGTEVSDIERTRPLILGVMLGEKSQSQLSKIVLQASGAGVITQARTAADGTVAQVLPEGWGKVLTQQLPDSALVPVATVIAREALTAGARFGAGTLGKVIPFGIGAAAGGLASFKFGSDVVKAARVAFPAPPTDFPSGLVDFHKPAPGSVEPSRAVKALQSAKNKAADFGEASWGKATDVAGVFRAVDTTGDGIPDEARALRTVKRTGSAIKGAATGGARAVGSRLKRKE
ncbi:hypothetical protein [Demequina aurantiaca]|uniref:hypothetical protein n=1 Tax=Demequina aurantiaca TaxID=676200 RepID=UPI0007823388|nr:hypothetical protein [Demequina aurantiaca]